MSLCLMKKFQTNLYVLCDVVFGYYRDLSSVVDARQWLPPTFLVSLTKMENQAREML